MPSPARLTRLSALIDEACVTKLDYAARDDLTEAITFYNEARKAIADGDTYYASLCVSWSEHAIAQALQLP